MLHTIQLYSKTCSRIHPTMKMSLQIFDLLIILPFIAVSLNTPFKVIQNVCCRFLIVHKLTYCVRNITITESIVLWLQNKRKKKCFYYPHVLCSTPVDLLLKIFCHNKHKYWNNSTLSRSVYVVLLLLFLSLVESKQTFA